MAHAKKNPLPLATVIARKEGRIDNRSHEAWRIDPLPGRLDFQFWLPGRPYPKSDPFWVQTKKGPKPVSDKGQVAAESSARNRIIEQLQLYYPDAIRHLPMQRGSVHVYALHLMDSPKKDEKWWPGMPHIKQPDVDNLGKLVKDAGAARTQGVYATLYWDDCPVVDDWERKVYWDPYNEDPEYPQQPGTLLAVSLLPLPRRPGYHHCPYCWENWLTAFSLHDHLPSCPIYNPEFIR